MKKKALIITSMVFVFSFLGCLSNADYVQMPDWVRNPTSISEKFLRGPVVTAKAREQAAEEARGEFAKLISLKVRYETIANGKLKKNNATYVIEGNITTTINTSSSLDDLFGVEVLSWQAKDGTYYAQAQMDKNKCSKLYADRIENTIPQIHKLIESSEKHPGTFEAVQDLNYASALYLINDHYFNILLILDKKKYDELKNKTNDMGNIQQRITDAKRDIVINIQVSNSKNDANFTKQLYSEFSAVFTTRGFKTVTDNENSVYFVTCEIKEEVATWQILVEIRNKDKETIVSWSSGGTSKKADGHNKDIVDSINTGFKQKFETYLGLLTENNPPQIRERENEQVELLPDFLFRAPEPTEPKKPENGIPEAEKSNSKPDWLFPGTGFARVHYVRAVPLEFSWGDNGLAGGVSCFDITFGVFPYASVGLEYLGVDWSSKPYTTFKIIDIHAGLLVPVTKRIYLYCNSILLLGTTSYSDSKWDERPKGLIWDHRDTSTNKETGKVTYSNWLFTPAIEAGFLIRSFGDDMGFSLSYRGEFFDDECKVHKARIAFVVFLN